MATEAALSAGPWDDSIGLDEDGYSSMVTAWFGPGGVIGDPSSTSLQPYGDSSGMQIKVRAGEVTWRGQWGRLNNESVIDIPANTSSYDRIDRVVVRRDASANTLKLVVIPGTPLATPLAPAVTDQDARVALVTVVAGAGTVGNPVQSIASTKCVDDRRYFPIGVTACTKDTRPDSPYGGQLIFVSDLARTEQWDGSAWRVLPFLDDTGWVECTPGPGIAHYAGGGSYPPKVQVRRKNGAVYLRGLGVWGGAAGTPSGGNFFNLPAGFAPPFAHRWASEYGVTQVDFVVSTAGRIIIAGNTPALVVGNPLSLDTSWLID